MISCTFWNLQLGVLLSEKSLDLLHANTGSILNLSDLQLEHPKLPTVARQIGISFSQHGYAEAGTR